MIQVIDQSSFRTPRANPTRLPLLGQPIHARLPLSLLEAVRSVDTPEADPDMDMVHEMRNKRLGLSETVNAQIRRYGAMIRKSQRTPYDEVLALCRLIGRRPDADIIFREAGRLVAQCALAAVPGTTRKAAVTLPALIGRPIALRQLRGIARTFLGGQLQRQGSSIVLEVVAPVSADAAAPSVGCSLYEAALRESLHTLVDAEGFVEHVACRARGDASCQWRTDWRKR